jgi:hypothetical protein
LNVSEDGLQMIVCFAPTTLTRLVVSLREEEDGSWGDWSRVLETSDEVRIPLEKGGAVDLQRSLPSVSYLQEPKYSLPDGRSSIGVTVDFDEAESAYYSASFPAEDLANMSPSEYLYSDGSVHSRPCEM